MVNGVRVANHQAAAHVKNGQVTSFSSSFGTDQHLAKRDLVVSEPKATLSFEEVSSIASTQLGIPVYSEFETRFRAVDFANKASYKGHPLPRRDPTEGFQLYLTLSLRRSSPNGWTDGKVTEGNNAITLTPSGKPLGQLETVCLRPSSIAKESQALLQILRPLQ
ncbi:hypothetical protein BASA60_006569 [Batrachochytrium salamandrivorans]|nr:hypothetical protein BASA60_006569 [Batrachochytrium salamandrivorans]